MDLTQAPFAEVIKKYENLLEDGRVVVRYSGTENLLRVLLEASTRDKAQALAVDLVEQLKNLFKAVS